MSTKITRSFKFQATKIVVEDKSIEYYGPSKEINGTSEKA
jgi:hypothetical protein